MFRQLHRAHHCLYWLRYDSRKTKRDKMTPTIDLLRSHRSIRHFTDEPITPAQREAIIDSARATSSSSFLQCSSIIRITDPAMREQLVTLTGGQKHVAQAAEFWVFCADFNRHLQICPQAELGLAEQLLLGVVDTALMAQNAFTAAESLGLGGVYIGGLRNNIESVTELLKLPKHVLPCLACALAGLRITRISSRACLRRCWCMKTTTSLSIRMCWRNTMKSWRTTT
jgi:nitroreductase